MIFYWERGRSKAPLLTKEEWKPFRLTRMVLLFNSRSAIPNPKLISTHATPER